MAPGRHGSRAESDDRDVSIRTIQRCQYSGNATMRAIVSGGPGMLWADQIFTELGKDMRRDQRHEDTAERATRGDGEVEGRKISRRRARPREFSMANHAGDK